MANSQVHAYSDKLSVSAGDSAAFIISAEGTAKLHVQAVRLIECDENPDGRGFVEEAVEAAGNQELRAWKQYVQSGNFEDKNGGVRYGSSMGQRAKKSAFRIR